MKIRYLVLLFFSIFISTSQEIDSLTRESLFRQDLSSLMNIEVYSASKKQEKIIDAPLSISSISYNDIKASGARNLVEALRLVPGVIVREGSNGTYDVHIRGGDNTRNFGEQFTISENSLTLVMINNRPVYDYFDGATFWESLPVSIEEIDKIEVIRGPSSAIYGPNAVSGVINILTKRLKENLLSTHVEAGNFSFYRMGATFSRKINEKLLIGVNTNFTEQHRSELNYYSRVRKQYLPADSLRFLGLPANKRYTEPDLAQRSYFLNMFGLYEINKAKITLDVGLQESKVQKVYVDNQTSILSTNKSNSNYVDAQFRSSKSLVQLYLKNGQQVIEGMRGWLYNTWNYELMGEHTLSFSKYYGITFGASGRSIVYDDQEAINLYGLNRALLKGKREINNFSVSIKNELNWYKLKLIFSTRMDRYNYPNDKYFSYHFVVSYKFFENLSLRVLHSKANRSPAFLNTYYSQNFGTATFTGNRDLDLTSNTLTELGLRANFGSYNIDLEFFHSFYKNFASPIFSGANNSSVFNYQFQNLSTRYVQNGVSIMNSYQINRNLKIDGHFTYSNSEFLNYYQNDSVVENKKASTPPYYGGVDVNYKYKKWRFNINYYFISAYTLTNLLLGYSREIPHVGFRQVCNSKLSYEVENIEVYLNVRNILSQGQEQLFFADRLQPMYSIGLRAKL